MIATLILWTLTAVCGVAAGSTRWSSATTDLLAVAAMATFMAGVVILTMAVLL
jgi:hypothetical protein